MQAAKRIASACLALLLVGAWVLPVWAAPETAEYRKKEVVYALLADDGATEQIMVVNHFEVSRAGHLSDPGAYQEIIRLIGQEKPILQNGHVEVDLSEGLWYYQGNLSSKDLPWLFHLSYELDGQAVEAAALSGANGHLKLKFQVEPNPLGAANFSDHALLQLSFSYEPERLRDLQAPGAMLAESGQKRLINYIVLPGQKANFSLEGEAQDFAWDSPTISAFNLNLDSLNLSGEGGLSEELKKLKLLHEGIAKLSVGGSALSQGSGQLGQAGQMVQSGLTRLKQEGQKLKEGAEQFFPGLQQYLQGLASYYDGVIEAASGGAALRQGAIQFGEGLRELISHNHELRQGSQQLLMGLATLRYGLQSQIQSFLPLIQALSELEQALNPTGEALPTLDFKALSDLLKSLKPLLQSLAVLPIDTSQIHEANQLIQGLFTELAASGVLTEEQLEKMARVQEILNNLDAQAEQLAQIVLLLQGFANQIDKVCEILEQMDELQKNMNIQSIAAIQAELNKLNCGLDDLVNGYQAFHLGLCEYLSGVSRLGKGYESMNMEEPGLLEGIKKLTDGLQELQNASRELNSANAKILENTPKLGSGLVQYIDGVSLLADQFGAFTKGQNQLTQGAGQLATGLKQLDEQTAFLEKLAGPDALRVLQEMSGKAPYRFESFVQPTSRQVDVQFIIRGRAIPAKQGNKLVQAEEKKEKGIWDLLMDLFR